MKRDTHFEVDAGARARILAALFAVLLFAAASLLSLRRSADTLRTTSVSPTAVFTASVTRGPTVGATQGPTGSFAISSQMHFFLKDALGNNTEVSSTEFSRAGTLQSGDLIDFRVPPPSIDLR